MAFGSAEGETVKRRGELQTMAEAFKEIIRGERPWTALGNFMNDWFDYSERRQELVSKPLPEYPPTRRCRHWAAFCAAMVEHFCTKYGEPCPVWIHHAKYTLSAPWFYHPQDHQREWQLQKTPESFKKRNVFCGDRMFLNKYELKEQYAEYFRRKRAVPA